eukprot:scaffold206544_cov46-Prasinocladus_malaysianus.AAC.1
MGLLEGGGQLHHGCDPLCTQFTPFLICAARLGIIAFQCCETWRPKRPNDKSALSTRELSYDTFPKKLKLMLGTSTLRFETDEQQLSVKNANAF